MTDRTVSILIPTYARTAWLQEALWCATHQTRPVAVLVLNDCPQQTLDCAHPLVTVINTSQRHETLGGKRNALLKTAWTTWVAWLDDDDWLLPSYIEDASAILSDCLDAIFTTRCLHAYGPSSSSDIAWYLGSATLPMIVRKEAALACGGFPEDRDYGEDLVFFQRLLHKTRTCSLASVSGYCYRWHNGTYHLSGSIDPLGGRRVAEDAERRISAGLEPQGHIALTPALPSDCLTDIETRFFLSNSNYPTQSLTEKSLCKQQTLLIAGQELRLMYPEELENFVGELFSGLLSQSVNRDIRVLLIERDWQSGRYRLAATGHETKRNIKPENLSEQLFEYLSALLAKQFTSGIVLKASAISIEGRIVLLPETDGNSAEELKHLLIRQAGEPHSDRFVFLDGNIMVQPGLCHPKSLAAVSVTEQTHAACPHRDKEHSSTGSIVSPPQRHMLLATRYRSITEALPTLILFSDHDRNRPPSLELLPATQTVLRLMSTVARANDATDHGFALISRFIRRTQALSVRYQDSRELCGLISQVVERVLESHFTSHGPGPPPGAPEYRPVPYRPLPKDPSDRTGSHSRARALQPDGETPLDLTRPQPHPRRKMTIGMATYDDFDGTYFSVQAMRLYHPRVIEECEILVLDNHPVGPGSQNLKDLERIIPHYRYIPQKRRQGSAVRDLIFRLAEGEFVLCMDSHVLIEPGALEKLFHFLDNTTECSDLLQGPLVHDDLTHVSTHFQSVWQNGMYGVWATDARGTERNHPPFEIPMQGLGLFCCRKESWPGLNPRFRGFGGEEGYLHEKFRRRGNRTMCLPFLRWLHRFGYPKGTPYRIDWQDRVCNYLFGHHELRLDSGPLREHFSRFLGEERAELLLSMAEQELSSPAFYFDTTYCLCSDAADLNASKRRQKLFGGLSMRRIECVVKSPAPTGETGGTILLHRKIVEEVRDSGAAHVLIVDEDACKTDSLLRSLSPFVRSPTDWSVILPSRPETKSDSHTDTNDTHAEPFSCGTSPAFTAYHYSVFDLLLDRLPILPQDLLDWQARNGTLTAFLRTVPGAVSLP